MIMGKERNKKISRREFLRLGGQGLLLGGTAFLLGKLIMGGKVRMTTAESCTNRGICAACQKSAACSLPQALSFRRVRQHGDGS
jgi:hypothetical protein